MKSNSKKKNINLIVIIAFIIIALLVLLLVITSTLGKESKNKNGNNNSELKDEEEEDFEEVINEFVYDGYVYTLPNDWNYNEEYEYDDVLNINYTTTVDGVPTNVGALISIEDISDTGHSKDEIFKNVSFFEKSLKKGDKANVVGEGKYSLVGDDTPAVIFPYYNAKESTNLLLAYMPAYDNFFYDIQFFTIKLIDSKQETVINYEDLQTLLEILNDKEKE